MPCCGYEFEVMSTMTMVVKGTSNSVSLHRLLMVIIYLQHISKQQRLYERIKRSKTNRSSLIVLQSNRVWEMVTRGYIPGEKWAKAPTASLRIGATLILTPPVVNIDDLSGGRWLHAYRLHAGIGGWLTRVIARAGWGRLGTWVGRWALVGVHIWTLLWIGHFLLTRSKWLDDDADDDVVWSVKLIRPEWDSKSTHTK